MRFHNAASRRLPMGFGMAVLAVAAGACSNSKATEEQGNFSSDPERAKIERIVHDYVMTHPEIIPEAMQRLQEREVAKLIDVHRKDIETPFGSAWAGNQSGDVILVEFFDYACGFCRASNPDVARLLAEDPKLKVVWREYPVLGNNSVLAAQASLAAAKQGKFKQFHDQLYAAGPPTADSIAKVQKTLGITAMQSPEFNQELGKNYELGQALEASGTPAFVIGDRIIHGARGYQVLKDAIAEARKNKAAKARA